RSGCCPTPARRLAERARSVERRIARDRGEVHVITVVITRDGELEGELPAAAGLRIGRDPQNDIVLNDASKGVSRFHAELQENDAVFSIIGPNSRNGVWSGNRKVQRATLATGVPVTIGPYELVLEERPSTATAVANVDAGVQTIVVSDAPAPAKG